MRLPWQLRATKREMMAVLPKPTLPTITTPWLAEDSLLRRQASTSWNSHSRPVKTASGVRLGTSKRSGFRVMSGGRYGAKCTASWETLGNAVNETGFIQTYTYILYIYPSKAYFSSSYRDVIHQTESFTVQSLFTMQQSFLTSRGRCFVWKRPELVAYASRSCSVKHHESMIVDRVPRPINARQKTHLK